MTATGKVYLIGAGPGDPELLTIKALKRIGEAQVVIYDRLVGQGVRDLIPEGAERIEAFERSAGQEEINELIARNAREGKRVVRLKGGDPFLFGRGGEEVQFLIQRGIEFEVVPGLTSALSVPALAGIPLTHRMLSSSVTILTGQRACEREINWKALVDLEGTIVVLMGVQNLRKNMEGLENAGLDPQTPAVLIERGSLEGQRTLASTIKELPDLAERERAIPPAVVVVGEVVRLGYR
jgi:uroporphyrin-III C-methyltransferase